MNMRINKVLQIQSKAYYMINEFTTEYGTIIFDDSREGTIHNCYMYSIICNNGQVDCYVDKYSGMFKSIWFVSLAGFEIEHREDFDLREKKEYAEPIVDVQEIWKGAPPMNEDGSWNRIKSELSVKLLHNRLDVVWLNFGVLSKQLELNEKITMFLDEESRLSGILVRDAEEVGKLLAKKLFL